VVKIVYQPAAVNMHVTYYATGRKPRPATITAIGSSNGGVILRVGRGSQVQTFGNGTTGILKRTSKSQTNVWMTK
jgi:hypothetical protein